MDLKKAFAKPAFQQSILILIDQGALSVTTFITGALLARAASQSEFGLYVLCWSILMLFQSLQYALTNLPTTVRLPKLPTNEHSQYLGSSLFFTIALTFVFAAGIIILGLIFTGTRLIPTIPISIYLLLAFATLAYVGRTHLRGSLLAQLEIRASLGASLIGSTLQLIGTVYLYSIDLLTIETALGVVATGNMVTILFILFRYSARFKIQTARLKRDLQENWQLGKWMTINVLGFFGSSQSFPWLILLFMDSTAVAAYGVCVATASLLSPLLNGMSAFVLPKMSHGIKDGNKQTLKRMLRQSMAGLFAIYSIWLLAGAIFQDEIISFIYGYKYSSYGSLFVLLLIKNTIESTATPITSALQASEKPFVVTYGLLTGSLVTIGLGSFTIPSLGLMGAGITAILAATSSVVIRWAGFQKTI